MEHVRSDKLGGGYATPNASALLNQYQGRASPTSNLVIESNDGQLIAQGTVSQLLPQAAAIEKVADYLNRYYIDSARFPTLLIPSAISGSVSFKSNGLFEQYLVRTASPIIPDSVLASGFQSTLGRAASSADVANMQASVNAGALLSTVQYNLAHTAEAAQRIQDVAQQTINRALSPSDLSSWQNALGTTSLASVRAAVANTPEASDRIQNISLQTLNRYLNPSDMRFWQSYLGTTSLQTVQATIATTSEASDRIQDVSLLLRDNLGEKIRQSG